MIFRKSIAIESGAIALVCIACQGVALAQGAPFTIRKPLDGSHVREKVHIEIPRASIGPGGFVAFYMDPTASDPGTFMLAQAPTASEEDADKPFTYVWDTKEAKVSDGEHSIKAILYEPAAGNAVAMSEKATTEVHITVENKIQPGPDVPTTFLLRYKYREGEVLDYFRTGKSVIVGHDSAMGGVRSDVEMMSARSKLVFSVEDVRFDKDVQATLALVRNKLTSLSILNGGQEYTLDPTTLSNSMYQELLPEGRVHYETGSTTGLAEFMAQGLPVNNTLELPLMPTLRVSVGDGWDTPGQRLDIPGLPPILQPVVTLRNKLVDLEYQGGYPCVKIHQSFSGALSAVMGPTHKQLPFGGMLITSPTLTYDRDIYIAYNSGTLVHTGRTLIIKGRTTANMGDVPEGAAGGGQGMIGPGGSGGRPMMGPGGSGGRPMMGPGGGPGLMGSGGGGRPMMGPGSGGGGGRPMMGPGGSGGRPMMGPGGSGGAGMMGPGGSGGRPMMGPGGSGGRPMSGFNGGGNGETDHPITIRSTTDTDLLTQSGATAAHGAAHTVSTTKAVKSKKSK